MYSINRFFHVKFLARMKSSVTRLYNSNTALYPSYNNHVKKLWSQNGNDSIKRTDLIFPIFISNNYDENFQLKNFSSNKRVGLKHLESYIENLCKKGLSSVILFGQINSELKDLNASNSKSSVNPIIQSIPILKKKFPHLNIICDICLCAYTSTGQCFVQDSNGGIDKLRSLKQISETALSYSLAGCDIVAPSDMIDNRVGEIKKLLISNNLNVSIMSYSGKLASSYYGPFRDAANSGCTSGPRINQLPVGSKMLVHRAVERDIEEGADYIIVKPGLHGLDLLSSLHNKYPDFPLFPYHVSGECAMLYHAAQNGSIDFEKCLMETMISFKRAGATGIITYFVPEILNIIN